MGVFHEKDAHYFVCLYAFTLMSSRDKEPRLRHISFKQPQIFPQRTDALVSGDL
jgi:hypothetical protein